MFSQNYYYLVAGLPEITLEQGKLQFGTRELREELKNGLSESDYKLFENLLLTYDNDNLLALIQKKNPVNGLEGVYSIAHLAEELKEPARLRPYMISFILSQQDETRLFPNLSPENELTTLYYTEMLGLKHNFLREWFTFELNLRNVMLVLSAKNHGMPYDNQIINVNEISAIIRRTNARDLGLSSDWSWIEKVMQISETSELLAREKATDTLRWNFLDEINTFNFFSIEVLMAFYIKLGIIERWLRLDKPTGEEMFRQLLGDLQNSYEFPNEFAIKDGRK
ncbi:MAG: DUF2764 domain-containing protein [Lentimicrobium sp.]|nr:DUF2764 domain-containing protein [Lentimicrobium sp.]